MYRVGPATPTPIRPPLSISSPRTRWTVGRSTFRARRWEAAVYRLGNLTLLESTANRRVGNASFIEKLCAYGQSAYALTRKIPEIAPEQWTLDLLDARQQHLAERAVHLWRADFA